MRREIKRFFMAEDLLAGGAGIGSNCLPDPSARTVSGLCILFCLFYHNSAGLKRGKATGTEAGGNVGNAGSAVFCLPGIASISPANTTSRTKIITEEVL